MHLKPVDLSIADSHDVLVSESPLGYFSHVDPRNSALHAPMLNQQAEVERCDATELPLIPTISIDQHDFSTNRIDHDRHELFSLVGPPIRMTVGIRCRDLTSKGATVSIGTTGIVLQILLHLDASDIHYT